MANRKRLMKDLEAAAGYAAAYATAMKEINPGDTKMSKQERQSIIAARQLVHQTRQEAGYDYDPEKGIWVKPKDVPSVLQQLTASKTKYGTWDKQRQVWVNAGKVTYAPPGVAVTPGADVGSVPVVAPETSGGGEYRNDQSGRTVPNAKATRTKPKLPGHRSTSRKGPTAPPAIPGKVGTKAFAEAALKRSKEGGVVRTKLEAERRKARELAAHRAAAYAETEQTQTNPSTLDKVMLELQGIGNTIFGVDLNGRPPRRRLARTGTTREAYSAATTASDYERQLEEFFYTEPKKNKRSK